MAGFVILTSPVAGPRWGADFGVLVAFADRDGTSSGCCQSQSWTSAASLPETPCGGNVLGNCCRRGSLHCNGETCTVVVPEARGWFHSRSGRGPGRGRVAAPRPHNLAVPATLPDADGCFSGRPASSRPSQGGIVSQVRQSRQSASCWQQPLWYCQSPGSHGLPENRQPLELTASDAKAMRATGRNNAETLPESEKTRRD